MAGGYALLDIGGGARLERFGERVTDRPLPVALGARRAPEAWQAAHLRFDRDGGWSGDPTAREPWPVDIDGLTFELRPTEAGQVGLFPEHAAMLPWLRDRVGARNEVTEWADGADAHGAKGAPAVLHLFAYTGLATLAMAGVGAAVTHVDAARPTIAWARREAELSGLADRPIRWIVDDAVAFTDREARRGRRYAGLVLDPPSYGHGPGGTAWRIDDGLERLLASAAHVLEPGGFALLTAHTPGFEADRLARLLGGAFARRSADVEAGELELTTEDGRRVALGAFARTAGGA